MFLLLQNFSLLFKNICPALPPMRSLYILTTYNHANCSNHFTFLQKYFLSKFVKKPLLYYDIKIVQMFYNEIIAWLSEKASDIYRKSGSKASKALCSHNTFHLTIISTRSRTSLSAQLYTICLAQNWGMLSSFCRCKLSDSFLADMLVTPG